MIGEQPGQLEALADFQCWGAEGLGAAAGCEGVILGVGLAPGVPGGCGGTVVSFCGATGLTAVAAPVGLGLALAANCCFSSGLSAW